MKLVTYGFVATIITFAFLMGVTTIMGHMTRTKESSTSLSSMLSQAVDSVMREKNYAINIDTQDKFVTDVLVSLVNSYSNNSEINIDVITADYEKGLLCLRLTEIYDDPNGGKSVVVADKTVVFEQDEALRAYQIIYIYNDQVFTSFSVDKGKQTTIIECPDVNKTWADINGTVYTPGEILYPVDNLILYAQWFWTDVHIYK